MADPIITQLACPNCLRPIDVREHGSEVLCQACGGQYRLSGHFCVRCFSYSVDEQEQCNVCGAPLIRRCDVCGAENWMGDEVCVDCQAVLGGEEILKLFREEPVTNRLRRQMHRAPRLKAVEAMAAEQRSAELAAQIEESRATERARREIQARKKRLILIAVAVLLIVLIILAAFALLTMNGA